MTAPTFTVDLVGGPAGLREFSIERTHDLTREFRLARTRASRGGSDLPDRFLALVDRLWGAADGREALVDPPEQRGGAVRLELPLGAEHDALALATLLDEADDYCRAGAALTMPRPPEVVRLRWWQATEAVRQRHGLAATPFPG
ncbi:MAG: hypothetical protein ACRDTP_05780 [Mycobacteriales bacterium]